MSTDQLPDGVERDRDVNEYGVEYGLWTRIEGHGKVREMWLSDRDEQFYIRPYADGRPYRRDIVIEMDEAQAKE